MACCWPTLCSSLRNVTRASCRKLAQALGGSVGAAVVDEDQLETVRTLFEPAHDLGIAVVDALNFIENGNDHGNVGPGPSGPAGGMTRDVGGDHRNPRLRIDKIRRQPAVRSRPAAAPC